MDDAVLRAQILAMPREEVKKLIFLLCDIGAIDVEKVKKEVA